MIYKTFTAFIISIVSTIATANTGSSVPEEVVAKTVMADCAEYGMRVSHAVLSVTASKNTEKKLENKKQFFKFISGLYGNNEAGRVAAKFNAEMLYARADLLEKSAKIKAPETDLEEEAQSKKVFIDEFSGCMKSVKKHRNVSKKEMCAIDVSGQNISKPYDAMIKSLADKCGY